jgi:multimeric flavodoxin WrbA
MKAILLNGSLENDNTGERLRATLMAQLHAQGWDVEHFALCERKIGNCAGDFFCFIRTPGVCNVDDDNRLIAEALVNSDLMIYLSPVTFGGYSPTLKRMVDHQLQNISPFFARVAGETHHARRYKKNPDLLVVGWMQAPDAQSEAVFRHLIQRIALNWHSNTWVSDVILTNQSDDELKALAQGWVDDIQDHKSSLQVELPTNAEPSTGHKPVEIQRALLLVGSPKTRKSTSNSLGGYLFEQLDERSVQTETIYPHTVLRNPQKMQALLDAVEAADLVILAFPLYCDSLPAPVIEALERIATYRQGRDPSHWQLFTAIANCGFPEAYQCDTALAICEIFANQAGFEWAGGLALGGGGMVDGFPLAEGGGKTIRMRQALDLAAEGLLEAGAIPNAAREGLAKPIIPHWMYWLTSWLRWNRDAKDYGARKLLKRQPYLASNKSHRS